MWLPVNNSHTVVIKMTFLPCRYGLLQGGISSIYKNVMELGKSLEQCLLMVYAGLFLCCGEKKPVHCACHKHDRDYL